MPPDFDDVRYWNQRFATQKKPFEWLQEPDDMMLQIFAAVDYIPKAERRILHIGSGSSLLSLRLRGLVDDPAYIHNVDFSIEAIQLGKQLEFDTLLDEDRSKGSNQYKGTVWSQVDLLNPRNVRELRRTQNDVLYNTIVDKSTCDSIACCGDVKFERSVLCRPRASTERALTRHEPLDEVSGTNMISAIKLLALHLATVAAPGACWIALSYSEYRFSFLEESSCDDTRNAYSTSAIEDSSAYWSLESKTPVGDVRVQTTIGIDGHIVHRPPTTSWLYILRRSDVDLCLNEC